MWNRRQSTKFNGTSYIVQKAAEAVYSPQGQQEVREMDSWTFFDRLIRECHIVGIPGVGFGSKGEGYFRLTAFNS